MIRIEKKITTINEKEFEYAIKGDKSPAVLLINGAGGPIEGWSKIWDQTGRDNVVFVYNRLGIGKSSKLKNHRLGLLWLKI
jgi:pimeloyl-ACP methyl ester carboxylesterase